MAGSVAWGLPGRVALREDGAEGAGCAERCRGRVARPTLTKPTATWSFSRSSQVVRSILARTHLTEKETEGTDHEEEGSVNCGARGGGD